MLVRVSQAAMLGVLLACAEPTAEARAPEVSPEIPEPTAPLAIEPVATEPSDSAAPVEPVAPEEPPSEAQPAATCPCDPVDWRCWQAHENVCRFEPPAPTTPATPAPRVDLPSDARDDTGEMRHGDDTEDDDPSVGWYRFDSWQRRGVLLGIPLGIAGCGRTWCEGFKVGGYGGLETGYRFGIVAPVIAGTIGGGRANVSEALREVGWNPAESSMRWIDFGIGLLLFPVRNGRVDPYFGARIGYSQFTQDVNYTGDDYRYRDAHATMRLKRGGVRFVAGLDFFVRPIFSLGPRFEVTVPFGGKVCISGDVEGFPGDTECMKIGDLADDNGSMIPLDPSDLPMNWSLSLFARFVLPRPPVPPP